MSRRATIAVVYLALLAASHAVRLARGRDAEPIPSGASGSAAVATIFTEVYTSDGPVAGPTAGERRVRLAYREWPGPAAPGAGETEAPVVLALHGSPGSSRDFRGLGPLLATRYRVLAPDLPGFGRSSARVPDYSIAAHARYALALLDRLGVERAHLIGFSMGGGVALELDALEPARVRSLTLLASIGVQELELLGEYHVNHALHGLQLGALWLLREAVPHFGALDDTMLSVEYARNFFDTDQRPLRAVLRRLEAPTLIVHGEHDFLVPYAAAREHHRIVPQSELVTLDEDHFTVFARPEVLAPPILDFLDRVEAGSAPTRATASAARRAAAAPVEGGPIARAKGVGLAVAVVLLALATMASEDLTCIAAGLIAAQGRIPFAAAAGACFAGIFLGDLLLYGAGRWLGPAALGHAPLRWLVRPSDVVRSRRWFARRGGMAIFLSRFVPGTRIPTYVGAGLLGMPLGWFAARLFLPVALWTPLLVGAAMLIGERLLASFEIFSRYALFALIATLLTLWLLLAAVRLLSSYRRRRFLAGWWRRWTRWEFWPLWALYPPVVLYVLWLGLRHRGATLFTAANPAIPSGGFAGEPKHDILSRLSPAAVPPFRLIPKRLGIAERCIAVEAFRAEHGLAYPLVLKPDAGERGAGVAVVRGPEALEPYFRRAVRDTLVQAYVGGPELGIFYYRRPGAARGRIFSITEKRLPAVTGDGRRTLERLILDDPRAVTRARVYLARHARRLDEVPAAGEEVRLGELCVHSRGALFRDGKALLTPALEDAVEAISRGFEGFYFGRYDLRAPSLEAFRAGRDLAVLELNGVSAEATHIYDPANGLLDAYRVLFAQWRLAFEIGAANRGRGVEPMPLGDLLRLIRRYRKEQKRI